MLSFRDILLAAVLIAIVGAVGYAGSTHNSFVWDDNFQILRNPSLHPDHPWESLFTSDVWAYLHPGRSGLSNYYRPLPMLAYRWLGGADPRPEAFRWASILFNVLAGWAACALIYLLSRRRGLSLAAALVFAAHPIHSEAVLWNSALSELGCALFYFLAFCLYLLAWREPDQPVAHPRRRKKSARELPSRPARHRIWFIAAAVFSYFAALLWKEMALSFPFLVAAHAIMTTTAAASIQARVRVALVRSAPFFAMTVAYAVVRFAVLGYLAKVQQGWVLTPLQFGLSAVRLVAEYWLKLLWPFPLNAYHVFTPARSLLDAGVVLSMLFVGGTGSDSARQLPMAPSQLCGSLGVRHLASRSQPPRRWCERLHRTLPVHSLAGILSAGGVACGRSVHPDTRACGPRSGCRRDGRDHGCKCHAGSGARFGLGIRLQLAVGYVAGLAELGRHPQWHGTGSARSEV
jgi:protein O-mannosyl-transferase